MPDIDATLAERGTRYADFRDNAVVAQQIKAVYRQSPNWDKLPAYLQEGLDMFASKISRMLTGDMLYDDNIHDIIGYAKLMQDRMAADREQFAPLSDLDPENFGEKAGELVLSEADLAPAPGTLTAEVTKSEGVADDTISDEEKYAFAKAELEDEEEERLVKSDGSQSPAPQFFHDPVRAYYAEKDAASAAPAMWKEFGGKVAWAYTSEAEITDAIDLAAADQRLTLLKGFVLQGRVLLTAMRQPDEAGVFALGAYEIPKN